MNRRLIAFKSYNGLQEIYVAASEIQYIIEPGCSTKDRPVTSIGMRGGEEIFVNESTDSVRTKYDNS